MGAAKENPEPMIVADVDAWREWLIAELNDRVHEQGQAQWARSTQS